MLRIYPLTSRVRGNAEDIFLLLVRGNVEDISPYYK